MTVSELERATQRSAQWSADDNHDCENAVLDLIADWRAMESFIVNVSMGNGDAQKAWLLLDQLKLKPRHQENQ